VTSFGLSAQAVSGVNTAVAPITGSGEDTTNFANTQVALNGLSAGSFAALAGAAGQASPSTTALGSTSGTPTSSFVYSSDGSTYDGGYVSGISAGSDTFSLAYTSNGAAANTKLPLAAADFSPLAVPEPSSFALLLGSGAGLLGMLRLRRMRS